MNKKKRSNEGAMREQKRKYRRSKRGAAVEGSDLLLTRVKAADMINEVVTQKINRLLLPKVSFDYSLITKFYILCYRKKIAPKLKISKKVYTNFF